MFIMSMTNYQTPPGNHAHRGRTEIDHVEYLRASILCDRSKRLAVRTSGDRDYLREMRSIVLHELDALVLLLPQFDVPVNGGGDEEVGPERFMSMYQLPGRLELLTLS